MVQESRWSIDKEGLIEVKLGRCPKVEHTYRDRNQTRLEKWLSRLEAEVLRRFQWGKWCQRSYRLKVCVGTC